MPFTTAPGTPLRERIFGSGVYAPSPPAPLPQGAREAFFFSSPLVGEDAPQGQERGLAV